ncbi:MAG: glycine zipper 2TM domain-containing protein [Rhodospirillales bacterium]|nr:glycine zipper 2TM domain-containing protein [Rhodospirillales bacterium]
MIAASAALALLIGCAELEGQQKQTGGVLLGGALGGLAGAQLGSGTGQVAAAAAGTLLGAFLGSEIGRSLDRADQLYMSRTTQQALDVAPSGTVSTWRNPDSGHSGTVTPTRTYQTETGQYCREFRQTVTIDGRIEEAQGRACRQPDGTWRVV